MPLMLVLLCFFSLASTQTGKNPEPIGMVDRVSGKWIRAQDGVELRRGELIFEGQTVLVERTTSASISIFMFATLQLWEKKCTEQSPCGGSYGPPVPTTQWGIFALFKSYWTPDRRLPPVLLAGRSFAGHGPNHALLQRLGTSVSLKPALEKVSAGLYTVKLSPAPDPLSVNVVSARDAAVRVGPDATPEIKGLTNGLYILTLVSEAGDTVGSNAVVLVSSSENGQVQEMWAEAKAQAQTWKAASPATVDIFLARVLYSLDAQLRHQ